ncbi:restriction endonuclease [Dyella halodurans]|uniref:Restriction endonuclease n=1 Tax=Dyella halodurans TaxID=1920171 RepID=A0ABV9C089_9GAMM|nr:restriction endonuclease [Dyella halodurans]
MLKTVPFDRLRTTDLHVDAHYTGRRSGNAGDDPLPALLSVDSQGGFRKRGKTQGQLTMLVLTSSMDDPDWPDTLDRESGVFTYYGDNKKPGRELHETGRHGNFILRKIFAAARAGAAGRAEVPPIFLFAATGVWRDVQFLGLAVPGASDLDASEELVAIWRIAGGERFQNYRARFTVLDAPTVSRAWIDSIINGQRDDHLAPEAWRRWIRGGRRTPLFANRSLEWRNSREQLPQDREGRAIIQTLQSHFTGRPHAFEHCAVAIAKLMIPDIATLDVTRPSRDGGRDAIGQMRLGRGASAILVDFALEAKCYTNRAVGVRDMSRLISRLRHRQFGVLVTTTCVDRQAYKEIKEDGHPIVIISAVDIVELFRASGRGTADLMSAWLHEQFPVEP